MLPTKTNDEPGAKQAQDDASADSAALEDFPNEMTRSNSKRRSASEGPGGSQAPREGPGGSRSERMSASRASSAGKGQKALKSFSRATEVLKKSNELLRKASPAEEYNFWLRIIQELCPDRHKGISPFAVPAGISFEEEVEFWREHIDRLSVPTGHRVEGGHLGEPWVKHRPPCKASHEEEKDFWLQKIAELAIPTEMLVERAMIVQEAERKEEVIMQVRRKSKKVAKEAYDRITRTASGKVKFSEADEDIVTFEKMEKEAMESASETKMEKEARLEKEAMASMRTVSSNRSRRDSDFGSDFSEELSPTTFNKRVSKSDFATTSEGSAPSSPANSVKRASLTSQRSSLLLTSPLSLKEATAQLQEQTQPQGRIARFGLFESYRPD